MIKSNSFPWVAATCEMITQELCFPEAADAGTEAYRENMRIKYERNMRIKMQHKITINIAELLYRI